MRVNRERLPHLLPDEWRPVTVGLRQEATRLEWKEPVTLYSGARVLNDEAFRVHEGRVISGLLDWRKPAKPGASHPPSGFHLTGTYTSCWQDYSFLPGHRNGDFRYLKLASEFDE